MRLWTLYIRSLSYHLRAHVAVVLGVVAGTATLTGALLVGDSVRGTLSEMALSRLGRIEHALVADRFFREQLAEDLNVSERFRERFDRACPAIIVRGGVTHANARTRVNRVQVLGVDKRFRTLDAGGRTMDLPGDSADRTVVLNEALARDLGAKVGEDVLIRVERPSAAPSETLLGRSDDRTQTLRLTVRAIVPAEGLGAFSIRPWQYVPRNAYVPLARLQRALGRAERVNAILVAGRLGAERDADEETGRLRESLREAARLEDYGLRMRHDAERNYFALESEQLLIDPAIEEAALAAAKAIRAPAARVLTYLANEISVVHESQERSSGIAIPYSTVSAVDIERMTEVSPPLSTTDDGGSSLGPGEVWINEWAVERLGASVGDRILLKYFVSGPFGRLESEDATLRLTGVVRMAGAGADPGFAPEYPGVTDAAHLSDWDPPFPVDLKRIGPADEAYWDRYRTTPKAFVALETGQQLWAESSARFGRLTSIRLGAAPGSDLSSTAGAFESELLGRLRPGRLGLAFDPVREEALRSSRGSTDFGGLFIGFSLFLIVSAAILVALLFRLGVERRAGETGILLATGFGAARVRRFLLGEGVVLAGVGGIIGLAGAGAYAWLMLAGLRSWWSAAVGGSFLRLHLSAISLGIGFVAGVGVMLISISWAIRGLTRVPCRALLSGIVGGEQAVAGMRRGSTSFRIAGVFGAVCVVLVVAPLLSENVSATTAFFGSGAAALICFLSALSGWLRLERRGTISNPGLSAMILLGARNGVRNPGRSLLTAGLIASATFVIVAVEAFRHQPPEGTSRKESGTGGYALLAESSIPLQADPNTHKGRELLNLSVLPGDALSDAKFTPFRLRQGDESSCLNLYQPRNPRILGATEGFIERGGFAFGSSLAGSDQEKANPWVLLRGDQADGAIPAIGDTNTVMWLMHLGLGKDLLIRDGRDRKVTLRIVGMLAGSILQGELVIAESNFLKLFPATSGYPFFLVDVPASGAAEVERALESQLAEYGLEVTNTRDRLAEYMRIESTYISTFQTLGGLGLILGTLGMGAVLLRNVFERRGELALMRALGFRRSALAVMVLSENASLMAAGLSAGCLSALLAVAPHALVGSGTIPWLSLGGTVAAVFAVGMAAGLAALVPTLRAPLLPALRTE